MKWLSCTILTFLIAAGAAQDDAAKKDLDALQGDWQAVSVEVDGKKKPDDEVKSARLTFKGDKVITTGKDMTKHEATFKLDPTKTPKVIDIMPSTGGDAGKTQVCVYAIEQEQLIICGAKGVGGARPTDLKAGENVVRIVLERVKPAKK
jgi:uncharacterized protein (TIGR03067 family)